MLKKIITLMLLCLIAFGCFACTPPNHFDYDNLKKGVTKVELIKCAESEEQSVYYPRKSSNVSNNKYIPFKFENMEIVETLAEEKVDDFLRIYSEIRFLYAEEEMNMPEGWCVRLVFEDAFHVISLDVNFVGIFTSEGLHIQRMGSETIPEEYRDILVNNFFETQI
ncbi:hypothetical protein [Pumilibacter muris]|uniref:hypothetical protein n=1 Tax=Pumilibacter muris TaxID=2941510 RepID=UPI00203D97E0|nr:hypothetical protein [Pumilibacter muris]